MKNHALIFWFNTAFINHDLFTSIEKLLITNNVVEIKDNLQSGAQIKNSGDIREDNIGDTT